MRIHLFAVLSLLGVAPITDAQDCRSGANVTDKCLEQHLINPTGDSPIQGSLSGIRYEAGRDDSKAEAFIGYDFTDQNAAYLRVSSPVEKTDEGDKQLTGLSGLNAGTTLKAGVHRIFFNPSADVTIQDRVCNAYKQEQKPPNPDAFVCTIQNLPEPYKTQYKQAINWGPTPKIAGILLTIATDQYKYFAEDQSSKKETKTGYGLSIGGGRFPSRGLYYYGASLQYETSYEAQPNVERCIPVTGGQECRTQGGGEPERATKFIAAVETRKFFRDRFGVTPRVSFEFRDDDVAVEVPIYFLRNTDGGFNGGIILGWQPEAKDAPAFSVSMFIGALTRTGRFWE